MITTQLDLRDGRISCTGRRDLGSLAVERAPVRAAVAEAISPYSALGAPAPDEPMNKLEPSGSVISRPFARKDRSLAWKPSDVDLDAGRNRVAIPTVTDQRVRRASFDLPLLFFAAVGRHFDMQPRVGVAELHLRDHAIELDRPIDVELGRKRVMGERGPHRRAEQPPATTLTILASHSPSPLRY